jgi:DsbC/DsbD-like thiol-disulfide interchange protein
MTVQGTKLADVAGTVGAVRFGVLVAVLGFACSGYGQAPQAIVKAKVVLATNAVHPGSRGRAAVIAQIAPGYHINDHHPSLNYLIPTNVSFAPENGFLVEKISYPKGKVQKFVFADQGLSVYQGELIISAVFQVSSAVAPGGQYTLRGQVSYQACNANSCFPPGSANFSLPVRVVGQKVPLKSANLQVFDQVSSK